jgi:hypothetical protein
MANAALPSTHELASIAEFHEARVVYVDDAYLHVTFPNTECAALWADFCGVSDRSRMRELPVSLVSEVTLIVKAP